jgi:hypothetical protein
MSDTSWVEAGIWLGILAILFIGPIAFSVSGIGSVRGQSTYTGVIVDTEIDKGIFFRPSTAHLKTHVRASLHESFCLPTGELEQKAMQYQKQGQKVRITYSRPLWVSPTECERSLSLVREMKPATEN